MAYFGNRGVHLYYGNNGALNRIDQRYLSLGAGLNDLIPNPFYGVITDPLSVLSKPTVTGIQLLAALPSVHVGQRRNGSADGELDLSCATITVHQAQLAWCFSVRTLHLLEMIDDDSLTGSLGWLGYDTGGVQSYNNLRLERAVSIYDRTHRAVIDFAYELPFGKGKAFGNGVPTWVDWIAGGWQATGSSPCRAVLHSYPR